MKSNVKIVRAPEANEPQTFSELEVGDWYDSASMWGLCVKTGRGSAWSVTRGVMVTDPLSTWPCYRVNVTVKFCRA